MKSQNEKQKTTETKKPRFKIEKLEERIAPHHRVWHNHGPGIHRCNPGSGTRCL